MQKVITHVGLDVHAERIVIASLEGQARDPVVRDIPNEPKVIRRTFQKLVAEEKHLYGERDMSDAQRARLSAINVELDRFWDLLRQRRALREFGRNPDEADVRPAAIVENYKG